MVRQQLHDTLLRRVKEPRRFIQVLAGPRQVGKTTLVRQVMEASPLPAHYASADEPTLRHRTWLEQQWDQARLQARQNATGALLVLDEIQKIPGWSDLVKLLWDADTHARLRLRVVLLGSSPLLVQSGLTESLAGRFEVIPVPHWSFTEMREGFGWDVGQFIFYGAYPGAAALVNEPERWRHYITDSLIETTISRDILLLTRVDKPALLRQLLYLSCDYSGQVLAYQKMLGQLHDAGNTVPLAHYLQLLHGAGMVAGLAKFSHGQVRQRGSSPKLQVLNTALMTAQSGRSFGGRGQRCGWSIYVRRHYRDGGLRVVPVERATRGDQLDETRVAVVVADVERHGQAVGARPGAQNRKAKHGENIPYAELGIRDIIPSR